MRLKVALCMYVCMYGIMHSKMTSNHIFDACVFCSIHLERELCLSFAICLSIPSFPSFFLHLNCILFFSFQALCLSHLWYLHLIISFETYTEYKISLHKWICISLFLFVLWARLQLLRFGWTHIHSETDTSFQNEWFHWRKIVVLDICVYSNVRGCS